MRDRVLTVGIEDDEVVIRIGIDTLKVATELSPVMPDCVVTDPLEWAKSVVSTLEFESEDGTTEVHKMFDAVFLEALDQGEEGVELVDDEDEDEDNSDEA